MYLFLFSSRNIKWLPKLSIASRITSYTQQRITHYHKVEFYSNGNGIPPKHTVVNTHIYAYANLPKYNLIVLSNGVPRTLVYALTTLFKINKSLAVCHSLSVWFLINNFCFLNSKHIYRHLLHRFFK